MTAWAGVEVHFSPKGGCQAMIIRSIDSARTEVDAAVYSFNNPAIAEALVRAHGRGVQVRLLLDRTQAGGRTNRIIIEQLLEAGIELKLHSRHRIEHNKFGVYDRQAVTTGSFNWTVPAEEKNSENCLRLDEPAAVDSYSRHFRENLWAENSPEKSQLALRKIFPSRRAVAGKPGAAGVKPFPGRTTR